MSEVKLNLIDSYETLHGKIHGSVVDAAVAALSAEPETIAELVSALARYIKPLDEVSPFASFRSTKISVPSDGVSQVEMFRGQEGGHAPAPLKAGTSGAQMATQVGLPQGQEGGHAPALLSTSSAAPQAAATQLGMSPISPGCSNGRVINLPDLDTQPWEAGIVVIDLAARIVAVESTYSLPQPEGEVHYHDGTSSTDIPVMYRLPDDWLFVNSVEAYQWSRGRRASERLARPPFDIREVLYGAPLFDFIVSEFGDIDIAKLSALAKQAAQHAVADRTAHAVADHTAEHAIADHAVVDHAGRYSGPDNDVTPNGIAGDAIANDAAPNDDVAEGALAEKISNIHAHWLMTPREDLRGQSPREVILARMDFIDFDLHTRAMQWSFLNEGPPCLGKNTFAYRYAGFGTHEFVIYYDLVRHLICSLVDSQSNGNPHRGSPTSNVQSQNPHSAISIQQSAIPQGQEGGHAPALLGGSTGAHAATQPAMSLVSTTCGSGWVDEVVISTLDRIKTAWLESPQPEYGGRIPAILIDNERKRLPEAMRPRDMIIDEDCPMCQMFGDDTTPLGMGVGFWHLDGCNMDEDFAFSSYKTREEWEAENRRRDEFNAEFNRKWQERQQRIARGEPIEFDPFLDPDPFELDDSSLISSESIDDNQDLPQ